MFCPLCKSEYREGWTRCSDCGAELVPNLATAQAAGVAQDPDADKPELLWSGIDPNAFTRIRAALDEAEIDYPDEQFDGRLLYASMRSPLEIWVRHSDLAAAKELVSHVAGIDEDAADEQDTSADNPVEEPLIPRRVNWLVRALAGVPVEDKPRRIEDVHADEIESASASAAHSIVEPFFAEDAIASVWSGEANGMAEILRDCLRENGIGAVISAEDGSADLRVLPENKSRAKEIVREVVEGAEPQ